MIMKCEVNVSNRQSAALGFQNQPRAGYCQAVLYLCGLYKGNGPITLSVCSAKNKEGLKHELKNNVKQVFDRFIREGKATIQLVEPSLDIYIRKANQIELRLFLANIKDAHLGEKLSESILNDRPVKAKDLKKAVTSMTINSPVDYRKAFPLPMSLEKITVQECSLTTINFRLLNLRNLTVMNLSNNKLSHLPTEFSKFKHLQQLFLSHNNLSKLRASLFEETSGLVGTLRILDVSHNSLTSIPKTLSHCLDLVELHVNDNQLQRLDMNFENLFRLRVLSLQSNQLKYLNSGIENLVSLNIMSIYDNPWMDVYALQTRTEPSPAAKKSSVPRLEELAARRALHSLKRNEINITDLPLMLRRYISCGRLCKCKKYCFEHCWYFMIPFDITWVCGHVVRADGSGTHAPLQSVLCSRACIAEFLPEFSLHSVMFRRF